jgi:hypothetical protein
MGPDKPALQTDPVRIADKTKPCPAVAWTPSIRSGFARERPLEVYKSSALCLRSQLPLTSSQSSRPRTLARANAIEQSAAP